MFLDNLDKLILLTDEPGTFVLVGGNFNARVGLLNSIDFDLPIPYLNESRASGDERVTERGKELVSRLEAHGLILLNVRTLGDTPAQHTFIGRNGQSVIDLAWWPLMNLPSFLDLKIATWPTRSDHLPVVCSFDVSLLPQDNIAFYWPRNYKMRSVILC